MNFLQDHDKVSKIHKLKQTAKIIEGVDTANFSIKFCNSSYVWKTKNSRKWRIKVEVITFWFIRQLDLTGSFFLFFFGLR